MLKSNKQFISISILLLSLMFLAGCSSDIEPSTEQTSPESNSNIDPVKYEHMGKAISAPVEIPYLIDNPIEIITINVPNSVNSQQDYFQIDGLADQAVEDKINKDIKDLFDQLVPYTTGEKIAPFRGIKSNLQPDYKVDSSSISVMPQFNSNNVLSVAAYLGGSYYNSTDEYIYFSMLETLNFDLNTGDIFTIEDVFVNNVDGLAIINDAIVNELDRTRLFTSNDYEEYTSFPLTAPFKGISNNQKFFLTYDGICIVIDHNNPEFDTGFVYNSVYIPFYSVKGDIAITERFYDKGKSIFTNEVASKRFLSENQRYESRTYNKNGTDWYLSTSITDNLSQSIISIMDKLLADQEELITQLSQEKPALYVEQSMSVNRVGRYINIDSRYVVGRENDSLWQECYYVYSENGEPIGLEDIFVKGYDYSTLINKAIDKAIKDYGYTQDLDREDFFENLMFTLNDSYIAFVTKGQESNLGNTQLYFTIFYKEIGLENLKIFDEGNLNVKNEWNNEDVVTETNNLFNQLTKTTMDESILDLPVHYKDVSFINDETIIFIAEGNLYRFNLVNETKEILLLNHFWGAQLNEQKDKAIGNNEKGIWIYDLAKESEEYILYSTEYEKLYNSQNESMEFYLLSPDLTNLIISIVGEWSEEYYLFDLLTGVMNKMEDLKDYELLGWYDDDTLIIYKGHKTSLDGTRSSWETYIRSDLYAYSIKDNSFTLIQEGADDTYYLFVRSGPDQPHTYLTEIYTEVEQTEEGISYKYQTSNIFKIEEDMTMKKINSMPFYEGRVAYVIDDDSYLVSYKREIEDNDQKAENNQIEEILVMFNNGYIYELGRNWEFDLSTIDYYNEKIIIPDYGREHAILYQ